MLLSQLVNTYRKVKVRVIFHLVALFRFQVYLKRKSHFSNMRIIVYSMGKVGSSSFYYSLMKYCPWIKIYHNHFLSHYWLHHRLPGTPFVRNIRLAKKTLSAIKKAKNINKYIVLVRDPIARDLSNVVQNSKNLEVDFYGNDVAHLVSEISKKGHRFSEEWFDSEFDSYFGISYKDLKFDSEKGYSIYELDQSNHLLIIQTECISDLFSKVIKEFLGIELDQYVFNESSKKLEGELYRRLKNHYRLGAEDLSRVYESEYCKHFYSSKDLLGFKSRWQISNSSI